MPLRLPALARERVTARMGLCFCAGCRKASGSGFIPFMNFDAAALTITGRWTVHTLRHADGREAGAQ